MIKKIAVLGGGLTGLTVSYYLSKKNYQVTLFEKEKILGGLASGFKKENWSWYLEKAIHHIFSNDWEIRSLASEIGYQRIFFRQPITASFDNFRIFPVDSPQDWLRLPDLSLTEKLRSGLILFFLKLSPFLSLYEKETAESFLSRSMGERGWRKLFEPLFRKKFGKYAGNILASFIWARIKKRTKKLGYFQGGFQGFINFLQKICEKNAVIIRNGVTVERIVKKKGRFIINKDEFDGVISTLPTPILIEVAKTVFPSRYLQRLKKIKYLHAVSLILETKTPVLEKIYWLNVLDKRLPLMGVFSHTNFIDKKYYGDHHLTYVSWYVDFSDKIWLMSKEEILDFILPYLNKIGNWEKKDLVDSFLFKAPFAQPIFDRQFLKNKPEFTTPVKNFYLANLDMTYPYDRGTNYAVELGGKVVKLL